jgi:glycosyltransferase involved in cell wall biosynthesis
MLKFAETEHEFIFLKLCDTGVIYEKRPLPPGIINIEEALSSEDINTPEACLPLRDKFEAILKKYSPDLVQAGPLHTCAYLTALSDFHPFMSMSWGSDILREAFHCEKANQAVRMALKTSDHLLCDCREVQEKAIELADYKLENITSFPWGIDIEEFHPRHGENDIRKKLGWQDKRVIISIRSWEKIYGIDTLLSAFAKAYQTHSDLRMIMLGAGSLKPEVDSFIEENGLSEVIYRPGMVPNNQLSDYFQAADIYVSCSHCDGSSISLLEAMGSGLPVVITDIPGNHEWITEHENGFFGKADDSDSFAAAIDKLFAMGTEQLEELKRNNRDKIEERADWNRNFIQLLNAYKGMTKK